MPFINTEITSDSSSANPAPVNTNEHSGNRGQSETLDADLILELGTSASQVIVVMRDLWNRGEKSEHFLRVREGLAVTLRLLVDDEGLAMPWTNLQKVMQEKGHLHTVTISGRTRVNRMLPFPKQEELGAVFVTAFLRKAGFTLD